MKLLVLTQKVDGDDPILGFMHAWIAEFAKHCERVTVIGLSVGPHNHLPENVSVFSLGKAQRGTLKNSKGVPFVPRLNYLWNFYRLILRERKNYDAVFVHMNPEYVILGGILWKAMGKSVGLWYTHKNVDRRLRLAAHGADIIFTASPESFRFATPKLHVMGHGIDVGRLASTTHLFGDRFRILSVGRISATKGYGVLLEALSLLKTGGKKFKATIIGGPLTEADEVYAATLRSEIFRRGLTDDVELLGSVSNAAIPDHLRRADLFVNMSKTGSLDKAVLEAMAAGVPVLTSNEGLRSALVGFESPCMFREGDANDFAEHVQSFMGMTEGERQVLGGQLRAVVAQSHDLKTLIPRILGSFQG